MLRSEPGPKQVGLEFKKKPIVWLFFFFFLGGAKMCNKFAAESITHCSLAQRARPVGWPCQRLPWCRPLPPHCRWCWTRALPQRPQWSFCGAETTHKQEFILDHNKSDRRSKPCKWVLQNKVELCHLKYDGENAAIVSYFIKSNY